MVVVIFIEWLLNVLLTLNRNMILHPSPHFMLLHVLISLLTRLRVKIFKTWLLHLGWFPRDYRAVVHEENWANCPFKRKLYVNCKQMMFSFHKKNRPLIYICFVWFDSLRPINNLSIIKGRVFLGWTSTKLGLMFLLKDTTQWCQWGWNPRPFGLESSTLPLSHCAPINLHLKTSVVA